MTLSHSSSSLITSIRPLARLLQVIFLVFIFVNGALDGLCQDTLVDLELSLVVDTSPSINEAEYRIMMEGYAKVFENPKFVSLAISGNLRAIAVNMVQFSGTSREVVGWHRIGSKIESDDFSTAIRQAARHSNAGGGTRIGVALENASRHFTTSRFTAPRQVMSVSGDGVTNGGSITSVARDEAIESGVDSIHGIVVGDAVGGEVETFYTNDVLGGESPILCTATTFEEFEAAILGKLTAVVQQATGDCSVLPTSLRFDQPNYTFDDGQPIAGFIDINPVPEHGLYSMGFRILVHNESGNLAGFITPTPFETLKFNGVHSSARTQTGQTGMLKGSADFFDPAMPTHLTPTVASFDIQSAPPGSYQLSMDIWNDLGPTEDIFVTGCCGTLDNLLTFGTATLTVVVRTPDLTHIGDLRFNPQTGLMEQTLTFTNTGTRPINNFRIFIDNLPTGIEFRNSQGTLNSIPYADLFTAIAPGASVNAVVEYFDPQRALATSPEFRIEKTDAIAPNPNSNGDLSLDLRVIEITGKGVLVEFLTQKDGVYVIEYSSDMTEWKVAQPSLTGTGQRVQWFDSGLPKTVSFPTAPRFYRITTKN